MLSVIAGLNVIVDFVCFCSVCLQHLSVTKNAKHFVRCLTFFQFGAIVYLLTTLAPCVTVDSTSKYWNGFHHTFELLHYSTFVWCCQVNNAYCIRKEKTN